jgi:NADPH:quinone reductase-like Zn-dependent oxidoreductase
MKAAIVTRYGPPDVVHVADVPRPTVRSDGVLVRVHMTTVNRTDCGYRAARPFFIRLFSGLARPRASILGTEFAGVVEEVGAEVDSVKSGERVYGYVEGSFGAHAEYLSMSADGWLVPIPGDLTFEQAAPSTEGAHYALSAIRRANISGGQDVLVYGATGAIGSAAVQLLKSVGATVTAVCSGDHAGLVRRLGADRVIDYTAEDFTKDHQAYDAVLDAVGKCSFAQCRRMLKAHGVFLSTDLGPYAQNPALALITPLLRGRLVKFPVPSTDRETISYIGELVASGRFKPVIDRAYPLDEIVEAYRYVETGQKIGNVVIRIDEEGRTA